MMGGKTAAIDADAEFAQIFAIIDPFMWTDPARATGWFGQYDLSGTIKADGLSVAGPARVLRSELLARAEDMLDALASAGWQPLGGPITMEFRAEVRNFRQTLAGVMTEPSAQHGISLKVALSIGRAR